MKKPCLALFFLIYVAITNAQSSPDAIIGKWMTVQNNLEVEVYKQSENYKAKILWFNDNDDKSRPLRSRLDDKNPDRSLRSRKWLGMEVLKDLRYNSQNRQWEDGKIYDAKNGKEWDAVARITEGNFLKVKGYWLLKFFSQTLTFKRV